MDINGGYPGEVSWGPSSASLSFPVAEMNGREQFLSGLGCWDGNLGAKCQLAGIGAGKYDRFLLNNVEMWNREKGDGEVDMRMRKEDRLSEQYGRPDRSRYLIDLNSPPIIVAEPHVSSTCLSHELTLATPTQNDGIEPKQVVSDIVNSGRTHNERFSLDEQPQPIIKQSKNTIPTQMETIGDFEKGSSDEISLNKTPQPKQTRRKHRPKVVIEGQTKSAKKSTPNPDGSTTGKRKYVRKITAEKSSMTETTEPTTVRQTRYSCRRKIDFDEDRNCHTYDKEFSVEKYPILESQALGPITPNKTEVKKPAKESRAKCHIDFSRDNEPSRIESSKKGQEARGSKREHSNKSLMGILSFFANGSIHFPAIYKKKRTEKCSVTSARHNSFPAARYAIKARETSTVYNKHMLAFGQVENFRKKRTKSLRRVRDLASFVGIIEGKKWPITHKYEASYRRHTCMEALAADFRASITTKKRTKRNFLASSSLYHNHHYLGFDSGLRWRSVYDIDALVRQFERLNMDGRTAEKDRNALVPYLTRYREKNALVLYQQDRSLVPFETSYNPTRRRKPRPRVDLDDETSRVWRLLLEDINSQGIDGTDEDKAKWWEEERNVFKGRAASFIARMHLVQGDRRFSQWKGSVVDSVIGVFLTQNVSDHLSSSAFMSLAARYLLKSKNANEQVQEEKCRSDLDETIGWNEGKSNQHDADADSYEEKEVGDLASSQNSFDTSPNSVLSSLAHTSERSGSCSLSNSIAELMDVPKTTVPSGPACFPFTMLNEVYSQDQTNKPSNRKIEQDKSDSMVDSREHSGISAESAIQAPGQADVQIFQGEMISENSKIDMNKETHEKNCESKDVLEIENFSAEISEVTESNNVKIVESNSNEHENLQTISGIDEGISKAKREKTGKAKRIKVNWDSLRVSAQISCKRERTVNTMDSLDYEAVRCADVNEIADTIKERGMNNMLAERIKDFLNRLVRDHGSIDLEWLRDVPPDKAKEYLLSFRGLGLKSVECVRLLTLHHLAFPVDTNVGRIAVRLGWVPLQPLPESLQLHLLELYPVLESIQKYLWPRLCKLDQRTLYELHYQMITFGKVFCTKSKPNCNACPMRGECRHFASAFASARLALPAPEKKSIVNAIENKRTGQSPAGMTSQHLLTLPLANQHLQQLSEARNHDPLIEEPATPEPEPVVEIPATPEPEKMQQEFDIEDFCEDPEEIPTIKLNIEDFTQNLQTYMKNNMELAEGDMSKALVALTSEAASIPTAKLKNVSQLRTEHQVYELPDSHPLLEGLDKREPDDPCSYLLAIWTPGETAESIQPPGEHCNSQESGTLCHKETCFLCNGIREANSQTVRGTLLIPCRTAMRGSFPLNGTYFQVNEVFADHDSSLNPIDVPRSWLWNLPRRTVYFGTSISTIFKGLTTEGIQYCFWRGYVCVRGFDQKTRAPRPLMARLHFPASKLKRSRGKTGEG